MHETKFYIRSFHSSCKSLKSPHWLLTISHRLRSHCVQAAFQLRFSRWYCNVRQWKSPISFLDFMPSSTVTYGLWGWKASKAWYCNDTDQMRGIAEAMPNADLVVVPEAGHMSPLENPDPVNSAIREFATQHWTATGSRQSIEKGTQWRVPLALPVLKSLRIKTENALAEPVAHFSTGCY